MPLYQIFDQDGKPRLVTSEISIERMRTLISEFKTHCATNGGAYEFNHFKIWLQKYYSIVIEYYNSNPIPLRVDM